MMRLQLNPFLLVLSTLAIVAGIVLIEYGSVWLTGTEPPLLLWLVYAVVIGVLALRAGRKRL